MLLAARLEAADPQNLPYFSQADLHLGLIMSSGDAFTGIAWGTPSTKNPKGSAFARRVDENGQVAMFGQPDRATAASSTSSTCGSCSTTSVTTWFFWSCRVRPRWPVRRSTAWSGADHFPSVRPRARCVLVTKKTRTKTRASALLSRVAKGAGFPRWSATFIPARLEMARAIRQMTATALGHGSGHDRALGISSREHQEDTESRACPRIRPRPQLPGRLLLSPSQGAPPVGCFPFPSDIATREEGRSDSTKPVNAGDRAVGLD